MSGPECGETVYAGRRARVDIGPCRRLAGTCGTENHLVLSRTGCLHCRRLVESDARRCIYCRHEPQTIDARCNCPAHIRERPGRAWVKRRAVPQIQPTGGERA